MPARRDPENVSALSKQVRGPTGDLALALDALVESVVCKGPPMTASSYLWAYRERKWLTSNGTRCLPLWPEPAVRTDVGELMSLCSRRTVCQQRRSAVGLKRVTVARSDRQRHCRHIRGGKASRTLQSKGAVLNMRCTVMRWGSAGRPSKEAD